MSRPKEIIFEDTRNSYAVAGGNYTVIISGAQTDGAYAVIDMLVPPGGGPGPHAHKDIQESFYVIEGEVVFRSETQVVQAGKGSSFVIPKGGAIHCFRNESDTVARLLCTVMPAGLDSFFQKIGEPVAANVFLPRKPMTEEAMQRIRDLGMQYGQEFFSPDYLEQK